MAWTRLSLRTLACSSRDSHHQQRVHGFYFILILTAIGLILLTKIHQTSLQLVEEDGVVPSYDFEEQDVAEDDHFLRTFQSPYIKMDANDTKESTHNKRDDKLIRWFQYTGFHDRRFRLGKEAFENCPENRCQIVEEKHDLSTVDAVLFHAIRNPHPPLRYRPEQVYILYDQEAPLKKRPFGLTEEWDGVFNWTWNYMLDADIWEPYYYLRLNEKVPSKEFFQKLTIHKSKASAWFVSHCETLSRREDYVQELQKYMQVDVYGECGTMSCPREGRDVCLEKLTKEYFFYLSFENTFCQDYITEKFFLMFLKDVHVVPVVMGGGDYETYFPPGTFINAGHFPDPRDLAHYLHSLTTDTRQYADMLWRKAHYDSSGYRGTQTAICELCKRLHNLETYRKEYKTVGMLQWKEKCYAPDFNF